MQDTNAGATPGTIEQLAESADLSAEVGAILEFFGRMEQTAPLARLGIAATLIGVSLLLLLVSRIYISRRVHKLQELPEGRVKPLRLQAQDLMASEDMRKFWLSVWRAVGWLLSAIFTLGAVTGVLMTSTITMQPAAQLLVLFADAIAYVWDRFVGYLPNLVTIVVIVLIARYLIRTISLVFEGIKTRRIHLKNFYPEWAETSFSLIKLLIYALTAVIVFPYLPGSSSPAFQGISIFVGVLVSLGSTTAVANVVAGVVLTYTRAFQVGDQVEVGEVRGRVLERSTFVTRIQTLKNVIVSVPNSAVLSNNIISYSKNMGRSGLLVHTSVTIGYDVPWQQVNELLVAAARKTDNITDYPDPFVLQTSLDDNYVAYEINGWTRKPEELPKIYSELHAHILDEFQLAGVEITSPHFRAVRDGGATTIPPQWQATTTNDAAAAASETNGEQKE
ncbi:MAG: mechanosensitive ion channel domain-containing protein [Pseudomonadota bacterium]